MLTAKHCAAGVDLELILNKQRVFFAIGANSQNAKSTEAIDVTGSDLSKGGAAGLGSDVAVYILAEPVEDVQPIPYLDRHLQSNEVSDKFTAVGYGLQEDGKTYGTRRRGTLTLQAVEGQPLHSIFGSKDNFVTHLERSETPEWIEDNQDKIDDFYDLTLLPGHEAYLGMGEGDAQPCPGDSGGPLLANIDGTLTVVAVASGSFKGESSPCSTVGEVYATLGESVQPMLKRVTGP